MVKKTMNYIDGEWVASASSRIFEVTNPATGCPWLIQLPAGLPSMDKLPEMTSKTVPPAMNPPTQPVPSPVVIMTLMASGEQIRRSMPKI